MAVDKLRVWLDEIRALQAAPADDAARAVLRTALAKRPGHVVAAAARHVGEHQLRELCPDLALAYARLAEGGVKADPGCAGKLAAVEVLSALEHPDPAPFLHAVTLVQPEKSWGPPVDTAANLRGHALMALVGLGRAGTAEQIALQLADPEPRARAAAAQCAVAWGDPVLGRALLLLRIRTDEDDPEVLAECFDGLIRLGAPDRVVGFLAGQDGRSEAAALALGSGKVAAAVPALIAWLASLHDPAARKVGLLAIGLTRTPPARDFLIGELAGNRRTAEAALEALAVYLPDPASRARIAAAAAAAGLDLPPE